jgi:hypothetical protein
VRLFDALWGIEDEIRTCEQKGEFSQRFIELARSVYQTNDRRAAVKRRINELLGSRIIEEKSSSSADRDAACFDDQEEPITDEQCRQEIEALAGPCECGGRFRFDAPIRCAVCRSVRIEEREIITMYD